jgi:hypothetical protein
MANSLVMERAMALTEIPKIRSGKMDIHTLMGNPGSAPSAPTNTQEFLRMVVDNPGEIFLAPAASGLWKFACLDESVAHYLATSQDMIAAARRSAKDRSWRSYDFDLSLKSYGAVAGADSESNYAAERIRHWLTYMILPALDKALLRAAKLETQQSLTSAAIALKRHRLRHGKYPTSLDALVPEFFPAVPVDFMDGKPLRYRLKPDDGFILYSVGEDGKDDEGNPEPAIKKERISSLFDGRDTVWPEPATAAEIETAEKAPTKNP